MANKSDKRIASENASTLALLKYGFLLTQLLQISSFILFSSQRTRSHLLLYTFTSLPAFFIYAQLYSMGKPRLSASGALQSAGDDLSQAGLTQYMMDVVFVVWGAQTIGLVTTRGWLMLGLIPGYALYKIGSIASPFLFKGQGQQPAQPARAAGGGRGGVGAGQSQNKEGLSKRQQKMQARYDKGDRRYQMTQKEVQQ